MKRFEELDSLRGLAALIDINQKILHLIENNLHNCGKEVMFNDTEEAMKVIENFIRDSKRGRVTPLSKLNRNQTNDRHEPQSNIGKAFQNKEEPSNN